MKSIAFIDGNNLYAAQKLLGQNIDYKKLPAALANRPARCMYYTTTKPDADFEAVRPLLDWLDYNGYQVVEKTMGAYDNGEGGTRYKGSSISDMIVDLMEIGPRIEHVTIFSGDGDLVRAVQSIQRRGVIVTVVSIKEKMCSDALRRQADEFIELDKLAIFKPVDAQETAAKPVRRLSLAG